MARVSSLSLSLFVASIGLVHAEGPRDPKFFANPGFMDRFPRATILHPGSASFVAQLDRTLNDGIKLLVTIQRDRELVRAVVEFPGLTDQSKVEVMKKIFALQVQTSGAQAPELVLDETSARSAFFEFDPARPSLGRVILNPGKLFADRNPYAALLLLLHETRHSFQFQRGFLDIGDLPGVMAEAYRTGFQAQRIVFDQKLNASFCDFLTLNHEYEAFLFANFLVEELTGGAVDTSQMGTLASQYDPSKGLLLDMRELIKQTEGTDSYAVMSAFNDREEEQYELIRRP